MKDEELPPDGKDRTVVLPRTENIPEGTAEFAAFSPETPGNAPVSPVSRLRALFGTSISLGFWSRTRTVSTLDIGTLVSGISGGGNEEPETDDSPESGEEFADLYAGFTVKETIAEGGQGRVSRAFDRKLRRIVAVKSLHDDLKNSNSSRGAFIAEARITGRLDHPAIVPVHGLFSDAENGLHLSCKLINGCTMKEYLERVSALYRGFPRGRIVANERRLLPQRIDMFLRVCEAVSYAHHKRIIHRDLKPENIMIGSFGEIYVMDWGIAEHQSKRTFRQIPGKLPGTVQYIAPEVIRHEPYDSRSDIYSLGLILFELVFLKRACPSASLEEAVVRARTGAVDSFSHAFGCRADRDLKAIIRRATAAEPAARYQNVTALLRDLHNYLHGEPVSACRNGLGGKLLRNIRRHSLPWLFVWIALLLLGAAAVSFSLFRDARDRVLLQRRNAAFEEVYSAGARAGSQFDSRFHSVENQLAAVVRESALLLESVSIPVRRKSFYGVFPGTGLNEAPPDFRFSPSYRQKIALDGGVYKVPPGEAVPDLELQLRRLEPLQQSFFRTVAGSFPGGSELPAEESAAKKAIRERLKPPVSWVYVSLENGLHLCYPYHDDYEAGYDPRRRPWYRAAVVSPGCLPVWSSPYFDNGGAPESVVSCSQAILDSSGRLLGVAGADISLTRLRGQLSRNGSRGDAVRNKYLIDGQGRILVDAGERDEDQLKPESGGFLQFHDSSLLKKMWFRKNGRIFSEENGVRYLYFFQEIETVHWLYVERIDFEKLVRGRSPRLRMEQM